MTHLTGLWWEWKWCKCMVNQKTTKSGHKSVQGSAMGKVWGLVGQTWIWDGLYYHQSCDLEKVLFHLEPQSPHLCRGVCSDLLRSGVGGGPEWGTPAGQGCGRWEQKASWPGAKLQSLSNKTLALGKTAPNSLLLNIYHGPYNPIKNQIT